jgi:hypothetical protein
VSSGTDCDDHDSGVHPGAAELSDGKDNNCNGEIDDGQIDEEIVKNTYFRDADSDGYGDKNSQISSCTAPSGYVRDNTDCDDHDSSVHPGAVEISDKKDNNCDQVIDECDQTNSGAGTGTASSASGGAGTGQIPDSTQFSLLQVLNQWRSGYQDSQTRLWQNMIAQGLVKKWSRMPYQRFSDSQTVNSFQSQRLFPRLWGDGFLQQQNEPPKPQAADSSNLQLDPPLLQYDLSHFQASDFKPYQPRFPQLWSSTPSQYQSELSNSQSNLLLQPQTNYNSNQSPNPLLQKLFRLY